MPIAVDRLLPTDESCDSIEFVRLGTAELQSLPQPAEWGGRGQPFGVYLQILDELAMRWVAVAASMRSKPSHSLLTFCSDEQKRRWLSDILCGNVIGANGRFEPRADSDAAAPRCADPIDGAGYARGYRVERCMREAKTTQLFEDTSHV
jgi:alkylation response protein AidB-like acyl-CoA dehydrogenase